MEKLQFSNFEYLEPLWSPEETLKIVHLMNTKHSLYLENESFDIKCGFNTQQLQLTVTLKKNDNSIIYPIEIVCLHEDYSHLKKINLAALILDYIDSYWTEYFDEDRNLFVPLDWTKYENEGVSFFLRGFVRHLNLEMQADLFLKENGFGEHDIMPISSET